MAGNVNSAIKILDSSLPQWLKRLRKDGWLKELAGYVSEVKKDERLDAEQRKAVVGLVLDENAPLKWGGEEVNAKGMAAEPKDAIEIIQSPVLGWYERLRGRDELVLELQRVREAEELKAKKEAGGREAKAKILVLQEAEDKKSEEWLRELQRSNRLQFGVLAVIITIIIVLSFAL